MSSEEKFARLNKVIKECEARHAYLTRNERDDNPTETSKAVINMIAELAMVIKDAKS